MILFDTHRSITKKSNNVSGFMSVVGCKKEGLICSRYASGTRTPGFWSLVVRSLSQIRKILYSSGFSIDGCG